MRSLRPEPFTPRYAAVVLAVVLAYAVTARLGLSLALPPEHKATAVFPASGIALAAVMVFGRRVWPAVWLGAVAANLMDYFEPANPFSFPAHLAVACCIATGSSLQAFCGATLVRRWVRGVDPLRRARTAFRFFALIPLVCLVAAGVGVTTLCASGFAPWSTFGFHAWAWWLGDGVGILVVTPLLVVWRERPPFLDRPWGLAEGAAMIGVSALAAWSVFGGWHSIGFEGGFRSYVTVPPIVWGAYRLARHGTTLALAVVAAIAVWGTAHGHGPFVRGSLADSLLDLQSFVAVLTVTGLALAAVLEERARVYRVQARLIRRLTRLIGEVKVLRGLIPICAWCRKIRNDDGLWQQIEAYLGEHSDAKFSHGICPDCAARELRQVKPAPRRDP